MLDQLNADDNVHIKSADEVTPGVYEVTYLFKFGKLWKKFREMVDKLRSIIAKTEEVNRIFKDIESGKVWERELDHALKVTDNDIKQMKQELAGKLKPDMMDDELD